MLEGAGQLASQIVEGFAFVIIVIVAIFIMIESGKELRERITRRRRFIKSFVTQEFVTARLREMALDLKELFDEQIWIQNGQHPSYVAREEASKNIAERIAEAKKEFWANVELAVDLKFLVPTTIEDALTGYCD